MIDAGRSQRLGRLSPAGLRASAKYEDIGYDELVTYSIYRLEAEGREATFENIVARCFELFPERFQLRGYPQWPDSARVNKSWLRCRSDKGYVVGRVKEGFRLTRAGSEVAKRVEAELQGKRPPRALARGGTDRSTKEGNLVGAIEKSGAFRAYVQSGHIDGVSEYDFRDALVCTMDTPAAVLNSNLHQFEDAATAQGRQDVLDFLSKSRARFESVLRPDAEHYAGGMMRRKGNRKESS